jgi:hypothetical protein
MPNSPQEFKHTDDVRRYLDRIYDEGHRRYTCRAINADEFQSWQQPAREALRELIGLPVIASTIDPDVSPKLIWESAEEDLEGYTRRKGRLMTEPDVGVPFWRLKPKGGGPFPLCLTPHGHESHGIDSYVGIFHNEKERRRFEEENGDVAVQAVRKGFLVIAPATRGLGCFGLPDLWGRFGNRDCRSHMLHCLVAGRTAIGERVWDMGRFIDFAVRDPEVNEEEILMMGNSGGGMVTLYSAACDDRIGTAIPSCAFSMFVRSEGYLSHCDCNTVPGILKFGEFFDIAGLIAPRNLLVVNGRYDQLHRPVDVDRALAGLRRIFNAAGAGDRFQSAYGEGGHRFYSDLMWPFVTLAKRKGM